MTVTVEKVGNRIHLRSSSAIRGLKDKLPGAGFSSRGGARWSLSLTWEMCELLREVFGDDLHIGPALRAWAVERRAEHARMAKIRSKKRAKLPILGKRFPALYAAVRRGRPYQSIGAKWIATGRRTIIGDGTGLGKTLQALAGVVESGVAGPYLIVCPKTATTVVWGPEIRQWLPGETVITFPEGKAARDKVWRGLQEAPSLAHTWVVVHPEMVRTKSWWVCRECGSETLLTSKPKLLVCEHDKDRTRTRHDHVFPQLFQYQWGAIVVDESDRSILRLSGTPTMVRRGMELLRDECQPEDGVRVAQSATPNRSRRHLTWSTLNWVRPDEYTGYWSWLAMFFELSKGYGSSMVLGKPIPARESALGRSLDRVMLRRVREEVTSLPPKLYIGTHLVPGDPGSPFGVWLDMTPAQARAYRQMEADGSADLDGGTLSAIGGLAEFTRLKQFASSFGRMEGAEFRPALPSNKFDYLLSVLEELGFPEEPSTKVIVASQFTQLLDLFAQELRSKFGLGAVAMVTGSVTGEQRAHMVAGFNQPIGSDAKFNPGIMLLNTKAGGSAITLDQADEMLILDETWTPDDQVQLEGRNDNRRPEEKVVQRRYRYLRSRGTVDEDIAKAGAILGADTDWLLDRRRGVEVLREMKEARR